MMKSNLRIMGVLILTALLAVFLTACGSGGDNDGNNVAAIVGTWNGTNEGTYDLNGVILTFTLNGTFTISSSEGSNDGAYTTNTSVTPHHIDMIYNEDVIWEGENLGKNFYGLYEINGDRLTLQRYLFN